LFGTARIPQLQNLVYANGSDELAHLMLGRAYYSDGRFMEAGAEFRRVIELNPDLPEAWDRMGDAFQAAGVDKEAGAAYRHGIRAAEKIGMRTAALSMQQKLDVLPKDESAY
jgi:Flp pilus assembly protein TadD